jgi:myosin-5
MSSDAAGTSNNIYIRDKEHGWIPGRIVSSDGNKTASVVASFPSIDCGQAALEEKEIIVKLDEYPQKSLPLQNVDENGALIEVNDMVDLSFLHEAAILYNLKNRHGRSIPYTRTGDIVIAVNPYQVRSLSLCL